MESFVTYKGSRILITGHTGFKGSWLSLWLSKLGAEVYGYSLPPDTTPNNYQVSSVKDLLTGETFADILDTTVLATAMRKADPDFIFHLAAQSLVRKSYDCPIRTFQTNVIGSLNILECVRDLQKPCTIVMVTSDKCYENTGQTQAYRESDPLGGYDPYSASKASTEIAVSSYRRSFFPDARLDEHGVHIATVRAGNVIGGGDWSADRIIPDAVRALSDRKTVMVRNPAAVRPWQHVLEPLSGYLMLGQMMDRNKDHSLSSAWNFGPYSHDECTVSELMDMFCNEWGSRSSWEQVALTTGPHEAAVLRLSIEKAVTQLQWKPRWRLHESIRRTASWYKNYYDDPGSSMQDICFADINAYMAAES